MPEDLAKHQMIRETSDHADTGASPERLPRRVVKYGCQRSVLRASLKIDEFVSPFSRHTLCKRESINYRRRDSSTLARIAGRHRSVSDPASFSRLTLDTITEHLAVKDLYSNGCHSAHPTEHDITQTARLENQKFILLRTRSADRLEDSPELKLFVLTDPNPLRDELIPIGRPVGRFEWGSGGVGTERFLKGNSSPLYNNAGQGSGLSPARGLPTSSNIQDEVTDLATPVDGDQRISKLPQSLNRISQLIRFGDIPDLRLYTLQYHGTADAKDTVPDDDYTTQTSLVSPVSPIDSTQSASPVSPNPRDREGVFKHEIIPVSNSTSAPAHPHPLQSNPITRELDRSETAQQEGESLPHSSCNSHKNVSHRKVFVLQAKGNVSKVSLHSLDTTMDMDIGEAPWAGPPGDVAEPDISPNGVQLSSILGKISLGVQPKRMREPPGTSTQSITQDGKQVARFMALTPISEAFEKLSSRRPSKRTNDDNHNLMDMMQVDESHEKRSLGGHGAERRGFVFKGALVGRRRA